MYAITYIYISKIFAKCHECFTLLTTSFITKENSSFKHWQPIISCQKFVKIRFTWSNKLKLDTLIDNYASIILQFTNYYSIGSICTSISCTICNSTFYTMFCSTKRMFDVNTFSMSLLVCTVRDRSERSKFMTYSIFCYYSVKMFE